MHQSSKFLVFGRTNNTDSVHVTNSEHEDDILENRPVAVKTTLALETSNLGEQKSFGYEDLKLVFRHILEPYKAM